MKREIPLLIVFLAGAIWLIQYFVPHYPFNKAMDIMSDWTKVIAAFAMVLGILNLLRVNFIKISRKSHNWQYSIFLIISLLVTIGFGCIQGIQEKVARTIFVYNKTDSKIVSTSLYTGGQLLKSLENFKPVKVTEKVADGKKVIVQKGILKINKDNGKFVEYKGLDMATRTIYSQNGKVMEKVVIKTGTVGNWIYKNMIEHLSSTMFSLLAFFIASAAFRAFRAKSFEAMLLLGSAFIVMLGKVPIGDLFFKFKLHDSVIISFPSAQNWIMKYINTAGQRAIMIGAAIGVIAISIKIIIGLERTYFGGE